MTETCETASLAILDGTDALIIQRVEGAAILRADLRVGARLELARTALGLLLSSHATPEKLAYIRSRKVALPSDDVMRQVRKQGYSVSVVTGPANRLGRRVRGLRQSQEMRGRDFNFWTQSGLPYPALCQRCGCSGRADQSANGACCMSMTAFALNPGQLDIARFMRAPTRIMRPERLAAFQPSRISAARALMNRAIRQQRWSIVCKRFEIGPDGRGEADYRIDIGGWRFSFAVYSFAPVSEGRTGRIIGRAWDMMGSLVEGDISAADFEKTGHELPKLYHGRATPRTLYSAPLSTAADGSSIMPCRRWPPAGNRMSACSRKAAI